jgi:hypothetical protein
MAETSAIGSKGRCGEEGGLRSLPCLLNRLFDYCTIIKEPPIHVLVLLNALCRKGMAQRNNVVSKMQQTQQSTDTRVIYCNNSGTSYTVLTVELCWCICIYLATNVYYF